MIKKFDIYIPGMIIRVKDGLLFGKEVAKVLPGQLCNFMPPFFIYNILDNPPRIINLKQKSL